MTNIFQFLGSIFIPHPYIALIPTIIFGLFYLKSKNKVILATTVLWLLYAVYEELHLLRVVCSGECNFRIDLLLIYLVLIVLSIIAFVLGIKNLAKSNSV
jgi:hypothetical protein